MPDIPSSVLVLDAGNSVIKYKNGSKEDSYSHAIHALSETQYHEIVQKAGETLSPDYLRINGKPYVVGESAESFGPTRVTGPARYTATYYGVFVASCLYRLYNRNAEVALFASHPSGDTAYRDELAKAAWGDWNVEHADDHLCFTVSYVNWFDEPVGGLFNVILSEDGQHYKKPEINEGRSLVIDIGGGTTDWQAVNPGGDLDYSVSLSSPIGIQEVEQRFTQSLRSKYKDAFRGMKHFRFERVREAIAKGIYRGGGKDYECENEVREATGKLLNRIYETYYDKAGGPTPWDNIVLTGGGSALLYERLLPILEHNSVILAEEPSRMHMANVRGGRKLWKFFEMQGWLV